MIDSETLQQWQCLTQKPKRSASQAVEATPPRVEPVGATMKESAPHLRKQDAGLAHYEGVDMSESKSKITNIGLVRPGPDGRTIFQYWAFDGQGRDVAGAAYVEGEIQTMGGWTPQELHEIAHGVPCLEQGCRFGVSLPPKEVRTDPAKV